MANRASTAGAAEERDHAVVTSLLPYGENDLIVRMFTAQNGRLTAFAKSGKRSKKRFSGLAILAGGEVTFAAKKSGDMVTLKQTLFTYDVDGFGRDPAQLGRAHYLLELTERLLDEREPMPQLFEDLVKALAALAQGADFRVLRAYELRLLQHTGYLPDLSAQAHPVVGYSPARSELLTDPSAKGVPFDETARNEALRLLEGDLLALEPLARPVGIALARVFSAHLKTMGIAPLKTVAYLKSLATYGLK